MSYSDDQTFTLEEVGAKELWVSYNRPGLLPYEEGEEFMKKYKLFNTKRMDINGQQTMQEFLSDANAEFEWVMQLISDWNLVYGKKHELAGQVLPIPSSNDGIWKQVPGLYLAFIVTTIKNDPTGSDFLAQGVQSSLVTSKPSLLESLQEEKDLIG